MTLWKLDLSLPWTTLWTIPLTFTTPEFFPSGHFWGIYALIGGVRVNSLQRSWIRWCSGASARLAFEWRSRNSEIRITQYTCKLSLLLYITEHYFGLSVLSSSHNLTLLIYCCCCCCCCYFCCYSYSYSYCYYNIIISTEVSKPTYYPSGIKIIQRRLQKI